MRILALDAALGPCSAALVEDGVLLAHRRSDDPRGASAILPGLVVAGIGVGLAAPVLVSAALEAVPRPRSGMASGAVNTFRQIGYALGIAAFGSLFASHITRKVVTSANHHAQNEIYLVAGLAAVACGLLALALIRPSRAAAPAAPPVPVMTTTPISKVE